MKPRIFTLSVLLVILTGLAACGGNESPTTTPVATEQKQTAIQPEPTPPHAQTEMPPTPLPPTATATPVPPTPQPTGVEETAQPKIKGRIDVGGHHLFINCGGAGSPTVILEAGWGDVGDTWSLVQPEIAQHTRVCSYDRAGMGNSEAGPEPRDMLRVVNELGTLLENTGVTGPYILVGHSWGGLFARLFADLHPQDVVGLVLVDSSHPDMFRRNLAVLPPESSDESEGIKSYREWYTSSIPHPTLKRALFEAGSLGDTPLVVLTAAFKDRTYKIPAELDAQLYEVWLELQKEWAEISSNSTHVIAQESGHFIHHDRPDLVIDGILQIVADAQR